MEHTWTHFCRLNAHSIPILVPFYRVTAAPKSNCSYNAIYIHIMMMMIIILSIFKALDFHSVLYVCTTSLSKAPRKQSQRKHDASVCVSLNCRRPPQRASSSLSDMDRLQRPQVSPALCKIVDRRSTSQKCRRNGARGSFPRGSYHRHLEACRS